MTIQVPRSIASAPGLRFPLTDNQLLIAMGAYEGISLVNKFGLNAVVGTANEDLWIPSGSQVAMAAASTLEVGSTDADDDGAPVDTGARTIRIEGFDASYDALDETVIMNGTTPVVTVGVFLGINDAFVLTAGASLGNEGIISIADDSTAWTAGAPDTAAAIQAKMAVAAGRAEQAIYTVLNGFTAYLTNVYVNTTTAQQITWQLVANDNATGIETIVMQGRTEDVGGAIAIGGYHKFTEQTTISLRALVDNTSGPVSGGFDLIVVQDSIYA